jgi:hypothetical protein
MNQNNYSYVSPNGSNRNSLNDELGDTYKNDKQLQQQNAMPQYYVNGRPMNLQQYTAATTFPAATPNYGSW